MTKHWYALHTKPYKESFVVAHLASETISHYYPTIPHPRHKQKTMPFFPGYLFVKADLAITGSNTFNFMRGCRGLVQFGDVPQVVPERVIAEVKRSVAVYQSRLDEGLKKGTAVTVTAGPFAGHTGIFERYTSGKDRVLILIQMLGAVAKPLTVSAQLVTA